MTDDDLVLYYYGDGLTDAQRADIARAIDTDPELAARYAILRESLDAMSPPVTSPPDATSVARWQAEIERLAGQQRPERPASRFDRWSFLFGSAVTAALALGIGLGVYFSNSSPSIVPPVTQPAPVASSQGPSAAFLRGIRLHLRDSRDTLAGLDAGRQTEQAQLALELIGQNRLYEQAAERNDAHQLARVLRAFELVLLQLAAEDLDSDTAAALRAELLFELNVVLTKLEVPPSDEQQTI